MTSKRQKNQVSDKNKYLSLICCYRELTRWEGFKESANLLAAGPIEFIGINNSSNDFTLPEAYNEGKKTAQGEFLFFVHDDVAFIEKGWDTLLLAAFRRLPDCGVLGFAGGTAAFSAPSTWWTNAGDNHVYRSMVRRSENGGYKRHQDSPTEVEVIGLDGFALAVRRELIEDFNWSNDIGNWHGYDIDMCYHVYFNRKKRNYVVPHVLVKHMSLGTMNRDWGVSMINVWIKYHWQLESQATNIQNIQALKIFANWTHCNDLFPELRAAMRVAGFDRFLIFFLQLCYSRFLALRRLGFRLLSQYRTSDA